MKREHVIRQLVATGKWSEQAVILGERAHYKCEYCDLDLLASPENYKQWQEDHIVPRSKGQNNDFDNLALSCRGCNVDFKRRWDPRERAGESATRDQLIQAAREYIAEQKARVSDQISQYRDIVK